MNNINFNSIQMKTNQFGWAGVQYSSNNRQAILYTKNSGANWTVVNPLNTIVLSICVVDSNSSWVYGLTNTNDQLIPTVFYTTDKGNTWYEIKVPVINDWEKTANVKVTLHAVDANNIWIILSRQSGINTFENNLYYTKNRGQGWMIKKDLTIVDFITGLTFIDSLNGFISIQKSYKNPTVYKTQDGGKTWIPIDNILYPPNTNQGFVISYKPIYKGDILIIPTKIFNNTSIFYLNISYDQGKTWTISNKILDTGKTAVSFFNSEFGWVIDSQTGTTYGIKNKGLDWTGLSNSPILKDIFCLHFFDPQNGWACNHTGIFKTTNGGTLWTAVPYTIDGTNLL
ncbi:Sortilin, neurotensin receptor 3 [Bacillus sp. 71mf]|uniref:VPS10 domain-containing protein n=2 Tax=unclassified Bacillus (in: firmicutes) TaxID=185979 RepID=UPI0008E29D78|nr:Sortilin, neurotensin receptor 3 [Bacillus sp. 71mf]SFS94712.1 Sortilin, neurotensin receptor 3 [Bacillus sp. 103mf]